MLSIKKVTVGQLKANCYIVSDEDNALIVDPGDDADYIMRVISDEELKPRMIIATHGHYDHILAVTEFKLAYKIPFLMHKDDECLLKNMKSSAKHFSGIKAGPEPKIDKYIRKGDKIILKNSSLEIKETPGHTPGSISIYNKKANFIIVGDVLFARGGVGRTDFSYSNKRDLKKSIVKILKLPGETVVYSGHGEESKIEESRKIFK